MEISYTEWIAAQDRIGEEIANDMAVNAGRGLGIYAPGRITTAALGPMPPEPAPKSFNVGDYTLVRAADPYREGHGKVAIPRHMLTPDEADAMALALTEHAAYARNQKEEK